MSIGLCVAFIALLYVTEETGYDLYHKRHENVFRVLNKTTQDGLQSINNPKIVQVFQDQVPEIIQSATYFEGFFSIAGTKDPERWFYADPEIVDVFTFNRISGNLNILKENPKTVLVSKQFALKHFKKASVVGEVLTIETHDRKQEFTIGAVYEDFPRKSTIAPDLIVPNSNSFAYKSMMEPQNYGSKRGQAYILIDKRAAIETVVEKMNKVYKAQPKIFDETYDLQPLVDVHLFSENIEGPSSGSLKRVIIYAVIGILILIISITNFLLLYTAIIKRRMKEFAVRKINGLRASGVLKIFLLESLTISIISAVTAVLLMKLVLPFFNDFSDSNLILSGNINYAFFCYAIAIVLMVTILAALYFNYYLIRFNAIEIIKESKLKKRKSFLLKNSTMFIQLVIVVILLAFSLVYYKQLDFMINSGKGFSVDNTLMIKKLNWDASHFKEEIRKYPVIKNVSEGTILPLHDGSARYSVALNKSPSKQVSMERFEVDVNYIPLYNIKLKAGRNFSKTFTTDTNGENIIVNGPAIKFLGITDNPINKETSQGTIIGVVDDFKFESLYNTLRPLFFKIPQSYSEYGGVIIKYEKGKRKEAVELINDLLSKEEVNVIKDKRRVNTMVRGQENVVFDPDYYETLINDIYSKDRILQRSILALAVIAVFITILGLIGMSLFKSEQRTKEIGIRKVNGATINEIMVMLNKDFIKWVGIAFVIACPIAYYAMIEWLENFAYKTGLSWWVFALAGLCTLVIALLTVSWQTYRAATRNPVESLRDE
ncbi:ABC transporter permease [Zhouia spongiae]|uniref:ABC transporter permease n=1 Tax=Zhouia spongiae TaxID=2202721 RepID=A0ABY3YL64_9FLAO|nr:ABC transporter permease [Zhouia spongiae]